MLAYQPVQSMEQTPLRRRAGGLALALGVNLLLILVLLGLGKFTPGKPGPSNPLVVDLPRGQDSAPAPARPRTHSPDKPVPQTRPVAAIKPPPILIPSKPTIAQPKSQPWIEMSSADVAAADLSTLAKSGSGGADGDSEEVGKAPNGDTLYAAEWARHPTNAELDGYLPANAQDGSGLIACKTLPGDRVDDCQELASSPPGSRLASAVRQAAWQFRVRPPRKNGRPLIGSWVRIEIDYEGLDRSRRRY